MTFAKSYPYDCPSLLVEFILSIHLHAPLSRRLSLSPGKYVMVMGVIQATSPEPVICAVKMADLSECAAVHRRMWKLEVEDLQQLLT